jgi:ribA/ribD-fused uncharacterized protein
MHEGHKFFNSEQAFMWEKAKFFDDYEIAEQLLSESNPKYAKALGRKVKNFDDTMWAVASFPAMIVVNFAKWNSSPHLKELLISTHPKKLVEASPFDKIWGVGLAQDNDLILDEKNWKGMNLLGKVLMNVRREIMEE